MISVKKIDKGKIEKLVLVGNMPIIFSDLTVLCESALRQIISAKGCEDKKEIIVSHFLMNFDKIILSEFGMNLKDDENGKEDENESN